MRTAIYVYQATSVNISTSENNLELCGMDAGSVSLSAGNNAKTLAPGIYKIVSSQEVGITGDHSTFDVTTFTKTNDPDFTPPRAIETFTSLEASALAAFLAAPDAKGVLHV
jgi:hypothetical protein